jgi:hypothetical protein
VLRRSTSNSKSAAKCERPGLRTLGAKPFYRTVSPAMLRAYAYGGLTDWMLCRRAIGPCASGWCWPLSASDEAACVLSLDLNFFCQLIAFCVSAANWDPCWNLPNMQIWTGNREFCGGPDRRRSGPQHPGTLVSNFNTLSPFRVGSRFGAETQESSALSMMRRGNDTRR